MKLTSILQINVHKLRQYKVKALFLILPITVLMILTIVVSSQVQNFQKAAENSIFGTIETQATRISLQKSSQAFDPNGNLYSSSDVDSIKQISNVQSSSLNALVPINRATTTDLFSNITYNINTVVEMDPINATLYTEEPFTYEGGKEIPIILNANTFIEQYEDWGGQDVIELTPRRVAAPTGTPENNGRNLLNSLNTPFKTRTISYNKNDLLGKTFKISFGGLDPAQTYKTERNSGTLKFIKLSQSDIDTAKSETKAAIEKYWNYDKLNTPLTYTFKIVSVIESESDNKTYIPTDFANTLIKQYVQNQLDARNGTEIPKNQLNSTYKGMTYDGTQLANENISGPRGGSGAAFSVNDNGQKSYVIPGLVTQLKDDGSQEVVGPYTDPDVYKNSDKKGPTISVKINSVYDRTQVVKDLNKAGFSYQDLNNLDIFNNLRNTLRTVSTGMAVAFIILSIAVIIFAMSKFVSESRKEIGIFRAIGMKKSSIVLLFTSQALLYSIVAYILGGILGLILNKISANFMKTWFDSLVLKTIKETFNVVNNVDTHVFSSIAGKTLVYYSLALLTITLLISLIPALKASSISPVEAIKGE